jgi:hypothetical protein
MAGGAGNDDFIYNSFDDILRVNVDQTLASVFGGEEAPIDVIGDFATGQDLMSMLNDVFIHDEVSVLIGVSYDGTNDTLEGPGGFVYSDLDGVLYYDDNTAQPGYYAVAEVDLGGAGDVQPHGLPA